MACVANLGKPLHADNPCSLINAPNNGQIRISGDGWGCEFPIDAKLLGR